MNGHFQIAASPRPDAGPWVFTRRLGLSSSPRARRVKLVGVSANPDTITWYWIRRCGIADLKGRKSPGPVPGPATDRALAPACQTAWVRQAADHMRRAARAA